MPFLLRTIIPHKMESCVLVAMLASLSTAASENFEVMVPQAPVIARVGSTLTLPCWLSPEMNVTDLEVRWYRPNNFEEPVLLYRDMGVQPKLSDRQYAGRVSLSIRVCTSKGLEMGDVSLKIENVTLQDAGAYECYVSSSGTYDVKSVLLSLTEVGTPPVMSAVPSSHGMLNISCLSHGWYPQPHLLWSDSQGHSHRPDGLTYKQSSLDLTSVHSWILVPPSLSDWLSCIITLQHELQQEGRVRLSTSSKSADFAGLWKAAFFTALLTMVVAAAILWFLIRKKRVYWDRQPISQSFEEEPCLSSSSEYKQGHREEECFCLEEDHTENTLGGHTKTDEDFERMRTYEVDITLDPETAHRALKLGADGKRVRDSLEVVNKCADSNIKRFTHHTCVLGNEPFHSGKVYWEVSLRESKVDVKKSWAVGVASESADRHTQEPLSSSKGFWVFSLEENRFHMNTKPCITFTVIQRPQTLGVWLDFDGGFLSFINVEEKKPILSLKVTFQEKVYPLFNPRKGEVAPLIVSPRSIENNPQMC